MPRISALLRKPANDFEGGLEVDVDDPLPGSDLNQLFDDRDGEMVPVDEPPPREVFEYDHGENLAESQDEQFLTRLGGDICEKVADDKDDRKPWVSRFDRGMEMIGLLDDAADDGPFPGSSSAILPLLSEAQISFWARALPELFPSEGPCKAKVMGTQTEQSIARGERLKDFLNYEMITVDRAYYAETSRLLSALPFQGCAFRKTYRDHVLKRTCGIFVPAEDLIVPSTAVDLRSAPHFTHRLFRTPNELRKLQVARFYRDVDCGFPDDASDDEIKQSKKELNDFEPESADINRADHELYEHYCELDLPGLEDIGEDGEPTGIALPYVVTVDRHSEKVLSIYRNWRESDDLKQRRLYFVKYSYLPGVGFYDFGLFHMLGGVQEAATGALRTLLDGAAMASLQGGFLAKDAMVKAERLTIEPGVWKPIESGADEFQKSFVTPPFKEPSPVLAQMLGILTTAVQRFTSTTDAMAGDGDQGAPVGTTIALLEQGHKTISAMHRGLYSALAEELEQRREIDGEYAPEGGYPFDQDGVPRTVYAEDFAPGAQIVPVSDPNIFSTTQRVQIAQATLQASEQHPDLVDRKVALRRYFEAIRVPDIKELMQVSADPQPMDPVSENQAFLMQKPCKAFPWQDHMAHIQVHLAFAQHPGFGGNPQVQPVVGPAMQAHIGEHLAYLYAQYMRQGGVPAPTLDPTTGQSTQPSVPPEVIAKMAAAISPQLAQMPGLPQTPQPNPAQQQAQQLAQLTQAKVQAIQQQTQAKLQANDAQQQQKMVHAEQEHQQNITQQADKNALDQQDQEHQLYIDGTQREIETQHQAVGAAIERTNLQTSVANERVALASSAHQAGIAAADRTHKLAVDTATRVAKLQQAKNPPPSSSPGQTT